MDFHPVTDYYCRGKRDVEGPVLSAPNWLLLTAYGRKCMVDTLEAPTAIGCLSDDHKGGMKEDSRPKAAIY